MDPCPLSHGNLYIFVVVDYIPNRVEAADYAKVVMKFEKRNIFSWFRTHRAIISDGRFHL